MELGTADQAKDLVKYYKNLDPAENKRQLELSISNTFSFLQVGHLGAGGGAFTGPMRIRFVTFVCVSEFSGGEFHSGSLRKGRALGSARHRQTLRRAALQPLPAIQGGRDRLQEEPGSGTRCGVRFDVSDPIPCFSFRRSSR